MTRLRDFRCLNVYPQRARLYVAHQIDGVDRTAWAIYLEPQWWIGGPFHAPNLVLHVPEYTTTPEILGGSEAINKL